MSHPGVALIEPTPGVFEHRTFEPGEPIAETHGIFLLNPETGRTERYAVAASPERYRYEPRSGGWLFADAGRRPQPSFLLHRATGQSWSWPAHVLWLVAASRDHLLFVQRSRGAWSGTGWFTITDRAMDEVGRFFIGGGAAALEPRGFFSPDGRMIALNVRGDSVYLIAVKAAQPTLLVQAGAAEGPTSVYIDRRYQGPGFLVAEYGPAGATPTQVQEHYFRWEDLSLVDPTPVACEGQPSPDGRYVARLVGGFVFQRHIGVQTWADPWPSVVIAETATCAPLLRVRSAFADPLFEHSPRWATAWLDTSDGFIIATFDGSRMVRVRPTPDLIALPGLGEPAPTGDGRYFGGTTKVYDAVEDRWIGPTFTSVVNGPAWWGDSHRERWFQIFPLYGDSPAKWLLLPPKMEFPPFSDAIAFRAAVPGSCLRLRAAPGEAGAIRDCLPHGARLLLTAPDAPPPDLLRPQPHPAVAWTGANFNPGSPWVHVRTAAGAVGWVSHDYLEHD